MWLFVFVTDSTLLTVEKTGSGISTCVVGMGKGIYLPY